MLTDAAASLGLKDDELRKFVKNERVKLENEKKEPHLQPTPLSALRSSNLVAFGHSFYAPLS